MQSVYTNPFSPFLPFLWHGFTEIPEEEEEVPREKRPLRAYFICMNTSPTGESWIELFFLLFWVMFHCRNSSFFSNMIFLWNWKIFCWSLLGVFSPPFESVPFIPSSYRTVSGTIPVQSICVAHLPPFWVGVRAGGGLWARLHRGGGDGGAIRSGAKGFPITFYNFKKSFIALYVVICTFPWFSKMTLLLEFYGETPSSTEHGG